MATNTYLLDKIKTEEGVVDLLAKSDGVNVNVTYNSVNKSLNAALGDILSSINNLPTGEGVDTKISAAISGLIAGAPETYDTLKEISDYITSGHGEIVDALNEAIGKKVDKVNGKGLSSNDFTDTLKNKLNGIASSATKVADSSTNGNILINGTETTVYGHPAAPKVTAADTKLMKVVGSDASGHVKISGEVTKADITKLGIPGQDTTYPEATTSNSGLMSSTDKTKLDSITKGATKVEASSTNGKVKINGTATNVYTHPAKTANTAAFVKVGNDSTGHVVVGAEVTKADINNLGVFGVRMGTSVPTDMVVGELFVKKITG